MKSGLKYRSSVRNFYILLILATLFIQCNSDHQLNNQEAVIENRVDSLLTLMTLEEKIGQMTQVRHFYDIKDEDIATRFIGSVIHTDGPVPGEDALAWQLRFIELQKIALSTRLGIPLIFGVDAIHGQNTFNGATIFPHNIGIGAAGNEKLLEEVARVTALEMHATGFRWTFAPCIAIPYNEKWGRFYEAYSESTSLTAKLASAAVKGFQGNDDHINILATAKHYLADGATDQGIEGGSCTLSGEEISKRLIPPYRTVVEEGIGAIMVSFNTVDSVLMHSNKVYITDTLKGSMGFDGIVLSDWKGFSRFGGIDIINAGVDMAMAVDGDLSVFQQELKEAVMQELVTMERIDDAVRRILRQKFRLGLFKNPFPEPSYIEKLGSPEHRSIARQAVRESLVLLKNNDDALPIMDNVKKIVVVGEHANNSGLQSGGWTIGWQGVRENYSGATTILEGIKNTTDCEVIYDIDASGKHMDADVAIVVVGETPYAEFMGDIKEGNPYSLTLSDSHKAYIDTYAGNGPALIVVLISGRPLVTTRQIEQSDAFVAAWLPGSEGDGIAEVLFGKYNFKGKLAHSWPGSTDDFNGNYGPNFWDNESAPLFEFGFGLTY